MRCVAIGVLGLALLSSLPARADEAAQREAHALFTAGNTQLQEGDYVGALQLFRSAYARVPNVKILLNIGTTLRQLGRFAEAADTYDDYLHDPGADPRKRAELVKLIADLDGRVGRLRVSVDGGAAQVRVDGKVVGKPGAVVLVRVDPGPHVISADREGATINAQNVTAVAGAEADVALHVAKAAVEAVVAPPVPPVPPDGRDAPAPVAAPPNLSHRGQLGAVLRADIDGQRAGAVGAFGLSFGLGDHAEINAVALVGQTKGFEAGGTALILKGAWKPLVSVGVPVFFMNGVHPGVHAAVGVEWDPIRYFGVFVQAGVAAFPDAPAGVDKVVFLPSAGLQPRIF